MEKIKTLFVRDFEKTFLVTPNITKGCEWVLEGEGVPYLKIDGTCCLIQDGKFYRRYTRKKTKQAKHKKEGFTPEDFKPAPDGWIPCIELPDFYTGSWVGWVEVDENNPADKHHIKGLNNLKISTGLELPHIRNGTYELMHLNKLVPHDTLAIVHEVPVTYEGLKQFLRFNYIEGIVFYHPDGRKAKIKRKDFGYDWKQE